jgi:enoyl-CoA hydratase/carnithine racemase
MGEFVRVDRDGAVATIRLDRPPANALARVVSEELGAAAREVAADPSVRAAVVWGGERIFAAGADVKAMAADGPSEIGPEVAALEGACRELEAIAKPVIAAITGYALGGGLEVALACDLRYASSEAKLGLPEISLGVIPGGGGTQRLPRLVGLGRARELVFTGRQVDAAEAREIGLVDGIVEGDVYAEALERARAFAAGPTLAYAAAKRALLATADLTAGLRTEHEAFVALFETRDQKEGMAAFLEKRAPSFEGR